MEIPLPKDLKWMVLGRDIDIEESSYDYKIVSFIDSAECVPCRLKYPEWNQVINELNENANINVECFTIIKSEDVGRINYLCKRDRYAHPIACASDIKLDFVSILPDNFEYQTVLLDSNNKIIAVGNPAVNPKVRKLYKEIIMDQEKIATYEKCYAKSAPVLSNKESEPTIFTIENNSDKKYTIQALVPSCDCISIVSFPDTLNPNTCMNIEISVTGDSTIGYYNKYVDIFYNEREKPDRLILYGYII